MPLFSSEIDLGPVVGVLSVLEVDPTSYYSSCLKQNSSEHDSTGSRVYTACHVLCRFIALFPQLFKNKRVVEIGCGVGVASIVACATTELEHALLTDGNDDVIAIAKLNIDNAALSLPGGSGRASAVKYSWGDISPGALTGGFDVVLGAELTYYNTDMNLLVSTVVRLLNEGKAEGENSGLFIHAHIFRKQDQEEELIQCFSDVGWSSAEVAVTTVVSAHELGERGNAWCRVRCLVSGPRDVIATLIADDPSASFFVFRPQNPLDDEDDESVKCDNTEDESFGLGSLFT